MSRFPFLEEVEVKRVGSVDQVAQILRAMIADGQLPQGERLPEIPMAQALRVSRNTLRDAIRMLAAEGLVSHELHRGAVVRVLSAEDIADIYRVRRFLELRAVAVLAERPEPDPAPVRVALDACEAAFRGGDYSGFVEHELEFHAALVAHLGSPRFDRFFAQLLGELRLVYSELSSDSEPATNKGILAVYRQIYESAAAGEVERAQELMRGHLDSYEARLIAAVRLSESRD